MTVALHQQLDPTTPTVSVVIPTCNRRDILEKCLSALAQQTHPSFEVIVVDDGSTDGTPVLLQSFAAAHPALNLRWLSNPRQSGANVARNRGISEARGQFIALTDSDAIAQPDWLEKLLRGFSNDRVAAVVGMVHDPPPRNIYDLTYRGNNRVHGNAAARLVGCNMAVRADVLRRFMMDQDPRLLAPMRGDNPDITVGDEEGLYLILKTAGYEQRVVPDAIVVHEHFYDRRSFFRQAWKGGAAAAYLVAKYGLPTRLDILPFLLALATIPLILLDRRTAWITLFFFAAACTALLYNELFRKNKTLLQSLLIFPMLVAYYFVRVAGYFAESVRIRLGKRNVQRVDMHLVRRAEGLPIQQKNPPAAQTPPAGQI